MSRLCPRALPPIAVAWTIALLAATGADAQDVPRYGAGWIGGVAYVTELNSDDPTTSLEPGAGAIIGIHVDRWMGESRRVGLRYQGAFQRPQFEWAQGERQIRTPSADLSVMARLVDPAGDSRLLPFVAAGLGGTWYDLGTGPETTFSPADAFHDGGSRILVTGVVAAAVDIISPWRWDRYPMRFRVEAADHITFDSPLRRASDGDRYGAVHHFRFTIGAHTVFSY